ncbi:glycosyltransferase family 4 protein [Salegentibacter agarivorans]
MHIAFLTPEYPHHLSTPSGGLGTSIKNLAEQMTEVGIQVSIFIYGQKQDLTENRNGLKLYFIRQKYFRFLGWWRYRKYLESYLNKIIKKEKIDVLEAPDWTGITAFMKFICPLVIRMNGSDAYFCHLENRPQKKKNFWFEKKALKGADHLISVSEFTAQKTADIFELNKEIKVIPNSVDTNLFIPSAEKPAVNTILYFGSIIRKKGVLELAEIFNMINKKNPEARLIMAGRDVRDITTGRSTKELFNDKLHPKAREKTFWLGSLPYNEIKMQISKAEVIVLPSFAEALPMTWLEAMSMEKALVTSNIGWATEVMIDGKTGYTVDPKDHLTYAAKILKLLEEKELNKKMGKLARQQVINRFSSEIVVEKNIQLYKGIMR